MSRYTTHGSRYRCLNCGRDIDEPLAHKCDGWPVECPVYGHRDRRDRMRVSLSLTIGRHGDTETMAELARRWRAEPVLTTALDQISRHAGAALADGMTADELRSILSTISRGAAAAIQKARQP